MAKTAGAGAAISSLPTSIARAMSIPATRKTGNILDVKHVVIFMQENRSFDHYFGTLKGVRGFGDPRPALMRNGKPVWMQPNDTLVQMPFALKGSGALVNDRTHCLETDPPHAWKYSQKMWAYHDMWIKEKTSISMGYLRRDDLPFYYALADAFTIGDAYHASVFGPTDPNRMFLFTGTSGVSVGQDGRHALSNVDDGNETSCMQRDKKGWKSPYHWTTYAERLEANKVSWKVYQEYDNYGDNSLAYFPQFRNLDLNNPEHQVRYSKARAYAGESDQLDAKGLPLNRNTPDAQALVDAFASDVKSGNLPAVSWIVAPTKFCEHPEKNPPGYGESLCSRLLDVLTADPEVWSQTVFILCYDEEGGFFDHVPPPSPPSSRDNGYSSVSTVGELSHGEAYGLGIRLPFIVASPWSKGGFVCSELFDHTSIIRFLEKRFNVAEPNISAWRRAVCGDLRSMFDFQTPDAQRPADLFSQPHQDFIALADASCVGKKSPEILTQSLARQESDNDAYPNTRPARALPYDIAVNGTLHGSTGQFEISFNNTGAAAASFTIYASSHNSGPWYYTIGVQQSFNESWPLADFGAEKYALRVLGPNGYLRVFQGFATNTLHIAVNAVPNSQQLGMLLHNSSDKTLSIALKDNFYGAPSQRIELAADSGYQLSWDTSASFGWYDFQFNIEGNEHDKQFLRRYAGHLENGLPSRSDPANGMVL